MVEITEDDGEKIVKITEDELNEIINGERRIDVTTGDGRRHSVGYDYISDNRYDGVKYDTTPHSTRSWEQLRDGEKEEIYWDTKNVKVQLADEAGEVVEIPHDELFEMGKEIIKAAESDKSITVDGMEIKPVDDEPDWEDVREEIDANNSFTGATIQTEDRDGNYCLYVYEREAEINHIPDGWYADYDANINGGGITFYPEE
jgi:hypothetical protein